MTTETETGRFRQRRRSRAAILSAARRLLAEGRTPTMSEVAEAAEVSRRTLYLHFPTLDQLLLDATLGALSESTVDEAFAAAQVEPEPRTRVQAMAAVVAAQTAQTLPLGRALLRLTVETGPESGPESGPKRGYRRLSWLERVIEPIQDRLTPAARDRLVAGLAVLLGWEALVVLEDVVDLGPDEQRETVLWAVRALVDAALAESTTQGRGDDLSS